MRLDDERESANIEDRRGFGGGGIPGGGIAVGGLGTVAIILIALFLGVDPGTLLNLVGGGAPEATRTTQTAPDSGPGGPGAEDPQRRFVARVLASTEDTWGRIFQGMGRSYQDPVLVLFSGATQSGCGTAQAAVGPFYCPADHRLYMDLDFLQRLQDRLGAQGDFARAYVIAHEVGHHVQTLLGITRQADAARARGDEDLARQVSIRIELQADCLAGVWANRANQAHPFLERGDVEQGINAAAAVGDDNIQRRTRGYVVPDSFTHGSSAQRVRWFRTGLQSGEVARCDTFGADRL